MSEWSVPVGGTKMADLLAELRRDRPPCPLCGEPVDGHSEPAKIYSVPVGPTPDRLALMPFHERCWPEAKERIERAREAVNARARAAEAN